MVGVVEVRATTALAATPRTLGRRDEAAKALGARHVAQKPGNQTFQSLCCGIAPEGIVYSSSEFSTLYIPRAQRSMRCCCMFMAPIT